MQDHMQVVHQSHLGIVKSKQRACEVLYWPGMSAKIEEMIKNCSKCADFQNRLPRELFKPTETADLPFEEVASDLFEFEDNHYDLLVDYYSKFIEVEKLKGPYCSAVVEALKAQFSRHGIPTTRLQDNGDRVSRPVTSTAANGQTAP
ncbi:putative protein K02A2.6-like protein [Labeo rohita]|uniref:Gypsy retrotransposon integrase-like protein 1 n=1 Tax=Labeo rohita TaxID=84645 RepID=A0A498L4A4_LABRO|nr:putative protein K02A2.6-like protein [Labeo rohita]RXN22449.1 putative protein K02A2.6-like protein [Labeo rohita]